MNTFWSFPKRAGSINKQKVRPVLLAFFLLSVVLTLSLASPQLEKELFKFIRINYLRPIFTSIPIPSEAKQVYQKFYGCSKCDFAGVAALYATDMAPAEVFRFYRGFIQSSHWIYGGAIEPQDKDEPSDEWWLDAKWPFEQDSLQDQQFWLLAMPSKDAALSLSYLPAEVAQTAINSGSTVFVMGVKYFQDKTVMARECPPLGGDCGDYYWEASSPEIRP